MITKWMIRCKIEEFLFEKEVLSLAGLTGFENAVAFEADSTTPTKAACVAEHNGKIIGAAGAAESSVDSVWEMGVDVREEIGRAHV